MWKDDGCNHSLIPKGGPPALQIRPPGGHGLVGRYGDNETIVVDAHDAKKKRDLWQYKEAYRIFGEWLFGKYNLP